MDLWYISVLIFWSLSRLLWLNSCIIIIVGVIKFGLRLSLFLMHIVNDELRWTQVILADTSLPVIHILLDLAKTNLIDMNTNEFW